MHPTNEYKNASKTTYINFIVLSTSLVFALLSNWLWVLLGGAIIMVANNFRNGRSLNSLKLDIGLLFVGVIALFWLKDAATMITIFIPAWILARHRAFDCENPKHKKTAG